MLNYVYDFENSFTIQVQSVNEFFHWDFYSFLNAFVFIWNDDQKNIMSFFTILVTIIK